MSQPGWPRIADIEVLLIAQQFITVQVDDNGNETTVCAIGRGILRDTLIGAGISLLEKEAGQPLLAAAGATAISHDPPGPRGARFAYPTGGGRLLRLKKPAVGITSVTLNGVPAYEGTDWWGHGPDDTCHTSLEFSRPIFGLPASVVVTAQWGRFAALPDELFDACVKAGGALAIQEFREGLKANPVRWQSVSTATSNAPSNSITRACSGCSSASARR